MFLHIFVVRVLGAYRVLQTEANPQFSDERLTEVNAP